MHALPLLNAVEITLAAPQTAAGTTEVKSSAVDCQGARSVMYDVILGTITATGTGVAKVQHSDTTTDGDFADVTGLSISWDDADDNVVLVLEHTKITKRYSRVVWTPATANSVLGGIVAHTLFQRKQPVTQPATTVTDFV